jgi:acyl carrier protein phosphodiesterase
LNYLAHAYLSFNEPGLLTGNMISDFVKGKKQFEYSLPIQKGISLHRAIDEFTDRHSITREAKKCFKPSYGLYSGAFMDVVYDHFLALDPVEFPGDSLSLFAQKTYQELEKVGPSLPDRFQKIFYFMRIQNWLYNYRNKEAIKNSFTGLVRRAAYMHDFETAFGIFEKNYDDLKNYYQLFFPDLKNFAMERFKALMENNRE